MKKIVCTVLLLLAAFLAALPVWAADDIAIYIDGERLATDVAPEIVNGVTFVPVRVVSEKLGATVEYSSLSKEVWVSNFDTNGSLIKLPLGQKTAKKSTELYLEGNINDPEVQAVAQLYPEIAAELAHMTTENFGGNFIIHSEITLLAAPYIKNGRTMLPLRFVSEELGCQVDWNAAAREIQITRQDGNAIHSMTIALLDKPGIDKETVQKDLVYKCAQMIEEARGEQTTQPANVTPLGYHGYIYTFKDLSGQTLASWQFFVPADEAEEIEGWSAMYLHDELNDQWYEADNSVWEYYSYTDVLEPALQDLWVRG